MKVPIIIIILLALFVSIGYAFVYKESAEDIDIYVNKRGDITIVNDDHIEHKFLIYADNEVFENTDDLFFFKFNSMDIQNQLSENHKYRVKVAGWRSPILSRTRNIIKVYNNDDK